MIARDQRPSRGVTVWARGAGNIGWEYSIQQYMEMHTDGIWQWFMFFIIINRNALYMILKY